MNDEHLISIDDFCYHYHIDATLVGTLNHHGLIKVFYQDDKEFIEIEKLQTIEKILRLYEDLNINIEGIDTVFNLLQKIAEQNNELIYLRNRLSFYEGQ